MQNDDLVFAAIMSAIKMRACPNPELEELNQHDSKASTIRCLTPEIQMWDANTKDLFYLCPSDSP